jgi:inner membrane transporter RhtA
MRFVVLLAGAASNQAGAAFGAQAFGAIGPAGVVAIRQLVAAVVLLPVARPDPRRLTRSQWWPVLLLGLVFVGMNFSLYTAIDRIGLGLAVTLEVLGPLAVALLASRGRADLGCALAAGAGVVLLVRPGPSGDLLGIGLGLCAAACWAAYILLNRVAGARLPGLQAPALASAAAALLTLPVTAVVVARHGLPAGALLAGLLSSVVPYATDLIVLRHVPPRLFGLAMSAHPVLAALAGAALLSETLAPPDLAAMAVIVTAVAVAGVRTRESPGQEGAGLPDQGLALRRAV